MFNQLRLKEALKQYKQNFAGTWWEEEKFKWEAVMWFQDHWDINAADFPEMLRRALKRTNNLLDSRKFPRGVILELAKAAPEEVRAMFLALFDEEKDVFERLNAFKSRADVLYMQYGKDDKKHFQDENAISTYLWLRYPDKYYIYKIGEVKAVAEMLEADYRFKNGAYAENIRNFLRFYDEINATLKADTELADLFRSRLTDSCYPDPELKTLTMDVGFYISRAYSKQTSEPDAFSECASAGDTPTSDEPKNYWWLNANPKIWSFSDIAVGSVQSYTLHNENGNKRRIFQNFLDARAGDMVIGYESTPVKQIVAIARVTAEQDGEKLCFEKIEGLTSPIDYTTLRGCPELENMEYFQNPQGSLFKLTEEEYNFILDLIREENPISAEATCALYGKAEFLDEVYMTEKQYDSLIVVLRNKKNLILQGAPGVGKTYAAMRLAWSMMGEQDDSRIELVQFHQSYSYEDFVMGYRPVENGFELQYGTFYRFCQKAANRPDKDFFFIIDEINRGNMSKIFGELLMLIEKDYRGDKAKVTLAYGNKPFSVPENLYIIGMMNTADRSLAMIDYALRRRFAFFEMEPGFDSDGFKRYQEGLNNETLNKLISTVKELNQRIDKLLGKGFRIGHSYFCGETVCTDEWLHAIVDYDILPMLREYWFDDDKELQRWETDLQKVFQ